MGEKTGIEWTDSTWSPIRARNLSTGKTGWHCEHVSEGCRNCYAESINRRLGTGLDFKPGHRADVEIFLDEKMLLAPLEWRKPRRIFVNSMSDTFAEFVKDEWIDRMFAVMALCPQHAFQVLTKRPERMRSYAVHLAVEDAVDVAMNAIAPQHWCARELQDYGGWPLRNVWLGTSAEDQDAANKRIPDLVATLAAVRFVSLEPLLGPIELEHIRMSETDEHSVFRTLNVLSGRRGHGSKFGFTETCDPLQAHLDWVIVGGESGPHARPMHPRWARDIRDQCAAAGVPFFFKQWGQWAPVYAGCPPEPAEQTWHILCKSDGTPNMVRPGKKAAGRLLDGIEHDGMPT